MKRSHVRFFSWLLIVVMVMALGDGIGQAQSGRNRKPPKPSAANSTGSTDTTTTTTSTPPETTGNNGQTGETGNDTGNATKTPATTKTPALVRADPADLADDGPALKIDATLVTVPVVVSDHNGRYVPFLKAEDFKLAEDSVKQEISFFAAENQPFNIALVMDTSGSITDSMSAIQESAVRFVRELRDEDKMMVVEFNSKVEVLNELTPDHNKIRHSIEVTRAGGGTRLYDALYTAANRLKAVEGRKAIILLTDGEDTESRNANERDAIDAVLESGALMYVIQFPADGGAMNSQPTFGIPPTFPGSGGRRSGSGQYSDIAFLGDLVKNTAGDRYYAGGRNGLPNVWRKIAEELRHVYIVGYYPSNPVENGGYRHIRLQLKDKETGAVRYKPGYAANKQQRARN